VIVVYLKNLIPGDDVVKIKGNDEIGLRFEGHSNLAFKGSDIVCSAVSAISQTSILAITKVAKVHQKIQQSNGFLESVIKINGIKSSNLDKLMVILDTMFIGLKEIMKNYPNALRLIFE